MFISRVQACLWAAHWAYWARTGTCCETDARATSCNHILIVQGDFVDIRANMRAPSCGPVQRSERKRLLWGSMKQLRWSVMLRTLYQYYPLLTFPWPFGRRPSLYELKLKFQCGQTRLDSYRSPSCGGTSIATGPRITVACQYECSIAVQHVALSRSRSI